METRRTRVLEATVQGPLRVTLPASDYLTASQTKQRRRRQATTPRFSRATGRSDRDIGDYLVDITDRNAIYDAIDNPAENPLYRHDR